MLPRDGFTPKFDYPEKPTNSDTPIPVFRAFSVQPKNEERGDDVEHPIIPTWFVYPPM